MRDRDDHASVTAFLKGEPDAVRKIRSWIAGVVRSPGWRFDDPENVIQEILVETLRAARRFEGRSRFRTFVRSVAKRRCIAMKRRRRVELVPADWEQGGREPAARQAQPDDRIARAERFRALAYIFQRLSAECRRVLGLVHFDGLSSSEVADRLGKTAVAVRVMVHRCLKTASRFSAELDRPLPDLVGKKT